MGGYYTLYGCTIEGITEFFDNTLSSEISDYPEGIVIPIDKPYRWTSADVVRKVKFQIQKHFRLKNLKVGHAGTLDPLATGLLIICVGKATKIAEELQSHEKEYIAEIEFGATTPSYDLEQEIDHHYPFSHITKERIETVLQQFIGEQEQIPPMFSAKIVGGLRAYEYARAGETVELRKSVITIFSMELISFIPAADIENDGISQQRDLQREENTVPHYCYHHSGEASDNGRPIAKIKVQCSKGTYIRSLARDIGTTLESGAYLISLRRTASGPFRLSE